MHAWSGWHGQAVCPMAVTTYGAEPGGAAGFWDFLSVSWLVQAKPTLSDIFISLSPGFGARHWLYWGLHLCHDACALWKDSLPGQLCLMRLQRSACEEIRFPLISESTGRSTSYPTWNTVLGVWHSFSYLLDQAPSLEALGAWTAPTLLPRNSSSSSLHNCASWRGSIYNQVIYWMFLSFTWQQFWLSFIF